MARWKFQGTTKDQSGRILPSATVSVYLSGTTTAASVYTSSTSSTAVNSVTSSSTGATYTFYTDSFDYDHDQAFKIIVSKANYTSVTYDNIPHGEVVLGTYTISTSKTVTTYVKVPKGVIYAKSGSGAIAFNGGFEAGLYQVFSGFDAGDVTFGSGAIKEVYPDWWVTNATPGTTDMTTAIQSAAATGGHVVLSSRMKNTTVINLNVAGTKISGINRGISLDSHGCDGIAIGANSVEVSTLTMNAYTAGGAAGDWTQDGVTAIAGGYPSIFLYLRINNVWLGGWDKAIYFYAVWDSVITSIETVITREFVRLSEGCARIQITNNLTNSSATGGIRADVYFEYVAAIRPEGILIQGNTFYGGDYGIYAPTGINGGITITDNDISSGISAIKLQTPNYSTIANNTSLLAQGANYVIDIPDEGTIVDHKNNISGNHIWNNSTGGGIYIGARSQNWIISNNIIDTADLAIVIGTLSEDIIVDSNIADKGATTGTDSVMQRIRLGDNLKNIAVTNNLNFRVSRADPTTENGAITVFNNTFDQKVTTRTIVPTLGTWNLGDRIFKNNTNPATTLLSSLGDILGWVCTSAGTFSAATDNTGDTTLDEPVITGLTDTSDFFVGDYVTVSAGMVSASIPYMITGKTATTITLLEAPTSTQSNVTIATPDPVFSTFGQQGYRSGAASPSGAVTPWFIGEEYLDSTAVRWYKSTGAGNTDWVALN